LKILSAGKLPKTEENYSICTCNATVIEAWNYCQCRNQVLATIRSKKQEKCFQAKLEQVQISLVWIGKRSLLCKVAHRACFKRLTVL